jgi:hypothetical protein
MQDAVNHRAVAALAGAALGKVEANPQSLRI